MKIGELAKATGSLVETIRFYEREGLLPKAARTDANYRMYSQADAERLAFIRNCRNLDMTLNEIRALLSFRDAPAENCGDVNALLDEHIEHVAARIRELKSLEKDLKSLRAQCSAAKAARDCGILQGLSDTTKSPSRKTPRSTHVHGQLASTTGALQAGQARVQELQAAVKEHDTVVARVAGAEAMANELRSTVEMLRELLKAAEERSARAGTPLAPARQPGAGEKASKGGA